MVTLIPGGGDKYSGRRTLKWVVFTLEMFLIRIKSRLDIKRKAQILAYRCLYVWLLLNTIC